MPLTLNQFLLLIITFAVVIAVIFLVIFLNQLRKTAAEGEKTLAEIRKLAEHLTELDLLVKARVEDMGQILESSKKTAASLSEAALFLSARVVRPASKYWPLLFPLARLVWRHLKKRKEKRNG